MVFLMLCFASCFVDENTELTNTEFRLRALLPGTAPFIQRPQFHGGMRQKHP